MFFIFGLINLAYYIRHANGKKVVRLFSSVILWTMELIFIFQDKISLEDFHYAIEYAIILLGLLPVLDTIVDWRGKTKKNKGG